MKKTIIGRVVFLLALAAIFSLSSCSHSTCPTYDENAGNGTSGSNGKAKSGLFPK